ncbi:MAG: S-layer homology domain-containing protein [Clostridia bacterium]|nr:S-layer homology domain-containing protein [Clostridia bacterium]
MRNKLLALILALTMAIGLVAMTPATVAAAGVETIGKDVVLEAAELLMTLNIVQGYEDGSLGLEKNITRAEFASMLARMLQGTDELNLNAGAIINTKLSETPENIAAVKAAQAGESGVNVGSKNYHTDIDSTDLADPSFSDISELHWAYNDVEYLRGQGIVTGYSDGTFKPDNNILYEEAVKFVVSALGYDFMAVTYGGYPEGYIKTASQLKILKNVEGQNGVAVTRQQIMVLLFNSLTADYLVLDKVDGEYNVYETNKNILNYVFGLDIIEKCYVVATEESGIDSVYDATEPGTVEIGEESDLGGTVFKVYNDKCKDYLGYRVKAYVKYDEYDPKKGELFCMFPYDKTKTITFKSEDVAKADVNDNLLEITIDEDEVEFELAEEPDVIYNGVAYARNLTDSTFDLESGDITLVSTTGTKVYDLIYINEYIPMYVETVKSSSKTIVGTSYYGGAVHEEYSVMLDEEKELDDNKEIKVTIIKADGTEGQFSDIKAGTVVYIRMWANHYIVNLGGTLVNGTVARKGSGYVVIGDKKYEEIEDSEILAEYKKGSNLKLGINKDGYVFYAEAKTGLASLNYGLLMDVAIDDESQAFGETALVKLMDASGKKVTYPLAENMKFTDMGTTTYRFNDEGKATSITADELFTLLKKSAKYASLQNGTSFASASAKRPYEQLIKYALDSNGAIKEIVTAMPSSQVPENEDKSAYFTFEDVSVSGAPYHINGGGMYGTPYTFNGTVMFRAAKTNPATDDLYNVTKWGTGARDGGHGHVLFDVAEDGTVAVVISGNDGGSASKSASEYGTYIMVEYMQDTVLDFEGEAEFGYEIGFINNGAYQTKYAVEDTSLDYGYLGADTDYNIGDVTNPYTWSKGGYWFGNYTITFDEFHKGSLTIEGDADKTFKMGYFPIKAVLSRIIEGTSDMYIYATDGSVSWGKWEREVVFGKVRTVANGKVIVEYGDGASEAIVCAVSGKKSASYDCETGFVKAVASTEVAEGDWVLLQMENKAFKSMAIYTNVEFADLDNIQKYENERD